MEIRHSMHFATVICLEVRILYHLILRHMLLPLVPLQTPKVWTLEKHQSVCVAQCRFFNRITCVCCLMFMNFVKHKPSSFNQYIHKCLPMLYVAYWVFEMIFQTSCPLQYQAASAAQAAHHQLIPFYRLNWKIRSSVNNYSNIKLIIYSILKSTKLWK